MNQQLTRRRSISQTTPNTSCGLVLAIVLLACFSEQADLQAKGLLAGPGAYGFAVSEISKGQIKQAVEMYRASNGSYPKDFDEFMNKVIKPNRIELPVLPGGRQYQYDVEKHELIVVEKEQAE